MPAKDLSLPLPLAEPVCVQNDHACRHDESKYFLKNDVINQVKLPQMSHINDKHFKGGSPRAEGVKVESGPEEVGSGNWAKSP